MKQSDKSGWLKDAAGADSKSGIYAIINRDNLRVYIGSAIHLRERLQSHIRKLASGTHVNSRLQGAFIESPGSLSPTIVEMVPDPSELIEREQFWIDFYKSSIPEHGYNIQPKAGSALGVKRLPLTAEQRKRISDSIPGRKFSHDHLQRLLAWGKLNRTHDVKVVQMSKDGAPIKLWRSISEAEIAFGRKSGGTNISYACKGKRRFALGYRWRYAADSDAGMIDGPFSVSIQPQCRQVVMVDESGMVVERHNSIHLAELAHGLGSVGRFLKGTRTPPKGRNLMWRYADV